MYSRNLGPFESKLAALIRANGFVAVIMFMPAYRVGSWSCSWMLETSFAVASRTSCMNSTDSASICAARGATTAVGSIAPS
eukprot:2024484-Prorocentrum_lima.AAC.1